MHLSTMLLLLNLRSTLRNRLSRESFLGPMTSCFAAPGHVTRRENKELCRVSMLAAAVGCISYAKGYLDFFDPGFIE